MEVNLEVSAPGKPSQPGGEAGADKGDMENSGRADTENSVGAVVTQRSSMGIKKSRSMNVEDDKVVPSAFEKFLVQKSCCACWSFCCVAFVMVLLFAAMIPAGGVEIVYETVWDVRSNLDVMKVHALDAAKKDMNTHELETNGTVSERSGFFQPLTIVYEVQSGNIFSEENIEKMKKVESVLVNSPKWQDYCMLITSGSSDAETRCSGGASALRFTHKGSAIQTALLDDGFGPCGGDAAQANLCQAAPFTVGNLPCVSQVFNPITDAADLDTDYIDELQCMCCADESQDCDGIASACENQNTAVLCGQTMQQARMDKRRAHIGTEFSCTTGSALRAKSWYEIGTPIEGKDDEDDVSSIVQPWVDGDLFTALWAVRNEVATDNFDVYFLGMFLSNQFQTKLMGDQLLAIGSIVIVFVWIWAGTGSAFLAMCGMIEIIFSLPLAGFLWGVLQMKFISFFQLSIVFLILGIGADDIFVLWDAHQQSQAVFKGTPDEDDEVVRFAWALRRARSAMLVTSLSTFFGFMACGISIIPSISAFGIFGALVVIFDFFMVISFFASAIVVYDRYFKKMCGPCAALQGLLAKCTCFSSGKDKEDDGLRPPERFFKEKVAPMICKFRWPIFIFWTLLGVGFLITSALLLSPATEAPTFFADAYGKRMNQLLSDGFLQSTGEFRIPVQIVMGINAEEPIDRSGTNYGDPEDLGTPVYDSQSITAVRESAGQLALWNLCEAGRNSFGRVSKAATCTTFMDRGVRVETGACMTGVVCFIDWVRDYRMQILGATEQNWHEQEDLQTTLMGPAFTPGAAAAAAFEAATGGIPCPGGCCDYYGAYTCLMYFVRTDNGLQEFNMWKSMTGWHIEGGSLQWAYISMNSTLELKGMPLGDILPHYDDWENFMEENKGGIPGMWQTCGMWSWMVTQEEILKSVFQSIGACLLLAFIILSVATANWIIASIALWCVMTILFLCGGAIALAGWELGIFEAVGLIVVVGLAVDYSVHICHSFNETRFINGQAARRYGKTEHALAEMGISVCSGAATTFLASLFLLPTSFMFYHVLGIFMVMTVLFSISVSLTMLPAMLCIMGPEGNRGDIACVHWAGAAISKYLTCSKKPQP
jgi:predicted RND superfamily exporter protein